MRIAQPKPFFFEHGKRAVLLLHGFTGTSADVRMLGRFLEKHDYTSLAPHYRGHGVPPEELIKTNPDQWWEDVLDAYKQLTDAGYEEIAVAGLSLGGVFSLKLAAEFPLKGVVTMCAPMTMKTTDLLYQGVLKYARDYKKFAGMEEEQIQQEMDELKTKSMPGLNDLRAMVEGVRKEVSQIYTPLLVVQSRHDEVIDPNSANIIYEEAESTEKELQWYEESGHVITLGPEKAQLHENVLQFLESLDWQE
ncbi:MULTISPECIES: carboxylesterase [unclassified Sporosarcina]|uniref:alpha/beta hydrolase n=1 Tax=unclassified Sporosarcina TaxID=2647733 RepID=UPI00203CF06D|nr:MULTISPECIES: carboxylesterase [unclassified Sporosarcina]GKV65535.1 carboxylesterase [Sporosarcina sp. NCCP-2331]GLB55660.1 carboxylesterase [Sporosarcina sp. NCCP-2378]